MLVEPKKPCMSTYCFTEVTARYHDYIKILHVHALDHILEYWGLTAAV